MTSKWSVLCLLVFVTDAALPDRGVSHRIGAIALGLLFGGLVVSELRANRKRKT